MKEDENIHDYYMNVLDIPNSFDSLGEKLTDEKLVRKILRSLPKIFDMKVTAVEEALDISNMKVDELIGSLQNFEIVINNREEKKEKNIAFISNDDAKDSQGDYENDERLSEEIVLLGRQFNKVLKQADWRPRSDGQNIKFNISEQHNNMKNSRTDDKGNQFKGVQCHECEDMVTFIKKQKKSLTTFIKKQKKSLTVSWSDEDVPERDDESKSTKQVTAMTGRVLSDTESCDEELAYDELAASYK